MINYFPLMIMGPLGLLLIIFRKPSAKFLIACENVWKGNRVAQKVPWATFAKEYDEDPNADRAMILLGIFFIFMGLIFTFFSKYFGLG